MNTRNTPSPAQPTVLNSGRPPIEDSGAGELHAKCEHSLSEEQEGAQIEFEDLDELEEGSRPTAIHTVAVYRTLDSDVGKRIDQTVTIQFAEMSRSEAQRLIELAASSPASLAAGIRVNGNGVKPNYRLREGDEITMDRPAPQAVSITAEDIPITVVYEDSHLMVIDKMRGMVVHPAPGAMTGTLVNAILAHAKDLSGIGGEIRPGIVHRLDKDTGGLLVVAKTDAAHRSLQSQIQSRNAERQYQALVWGTPNFKQARIEAAIGRHPHDRKKMAVITDTAHTSRSAITDLTLIREYGSLFSLWRAKLQTGRTHQIRVHCAYVHYPIVGDTAYGGIRKMPAATPLGKLQAHVDAAIAELHGQALHAYSLSFNHPETGERLEFTSPLPPPIQRIIDLLDVAYYPETIS